MGNHSSRSRKYETGRKQHHSTRQHTLDSSSSHPTRHRQSRRSRTKSPAPLFKSRYTEIHDNDESKPIASSVLDNFSKPKTLQIPTENSSVNSKLLSLDDIDDIVSMYLGPKNSSQAQQINLLSPDSGVSLVNSLISLSSSNQFETAFSQSDNYYTEYERRLLEQPRPQPHGDVVEIDFNWQRGDRLGSGAYGTVYLALNVDEGTLIATKQVALSSDDSSTVSTASDGKGFKKVSHIQSNELVQALVQEINVLRTLKHENIVQYFGTQRDRDFVNIFLEFVPGGSIASMLKRFGKFNENLVRVYTKQILLGLEYLHRHHIMHRDIKGANILVDNQGICKLADFGAAAHLADISQAQRRSIQGTPYWMAPEIIKQTGHGRYADIWSVGCTVIEMVTGKPPWHEFKTPTAVFFRIAAAVEPPTLPKDVSSELRDFVLSCVQRDPCQRSNATRLLQHPFITRPNASSLNPRSTLSRASSSTQDSSNKSNMEHPEVGPDHVIDYLSEKYHSAMDSLSGPFRDTFAPLQPKAPKASTSMLMVNDSSSPSSSSSPPSSSSLRLSPPSSSLRPSPPSSSSSLRPSPPSSSSSSLRPPPPPPSSSLRPSPPSSSSSSLRPTPKCDDENSVHVLNTINDTKSENEWKTKVEKNSTL